MSDPERCGTCGWVPWDCACGVEVVWREGGQERTVTLGSLYADNAGDEDTCEKLDYLAEGPVTVVLLGGGAQPLVRLERVSATLKAEGGGA